MNGYPSIFREISVGGFAPRSKIYIKITYDRRISLRQWGLMTTLPIISQKSKEYSPILQSQVAMPTPDSLAFAAR